MPTGLKIVVGFFGTTLICCAVSNAISPNIIAGLFYLLREGGFAWSALVLIIVGAGLLNVNSSHNNEDWIGIIGLSMVLIGIGFIPLQFVRNYNVNLELLKTTKVIEATTYLDGFDARFVSYDDALLSFENNLGFTGATLGNVTFINDENGQRWTGIADGDGFARSLKGVISLKPDGTYERCFMTGQAVKGMLGNSIVDGIRHEKFFVRVIVEDAYGDCINGVGTIYIPLTDLVGFWGVPIPAGIAVVDSNGNISVYDKKIPEGLPGPTYPESIAKSQEKSLDYANGFWDAFFQNYGFTETTGDDDPNSENAGQYNLSLHGSGYSTYYVTPLTPVGSSKSFAGMNVVANNVQLPWQYNDSVFVKFPNPISGTRERANLIKQVYKDTPGFNWINLQIREIVPGPFGKYVAYLGQDTTLYYLVTIEVDGTMTAVDVKTGQVINNAVNVVTTTSESEPTQIVPTSLPDVTATPFPNGSTVFVIDTNTLEQMSNEEFLILYDLVMQEAQRRLNSQP